MTAVAWLVHLYTASGFVLALLAAQSAIDHDYRRAFLYLWVQVAVDATDGWLARWARVSERLPHVGGGKLDDLVDYLTYAFVPALIVWRGLFVPGAWATWVAGAMLVSSGYGFSRLDAKTPDHFFMGFPSYWNVVVMYLFLLGTTPAVNLVILVVLCVLVFVPLRYVYPSRSPVAAVSTNLLGAAWAVVVVAMLWAHPAVPRWWLAASFVFPVYYVGLSFWLEARRLTSARTGSGGGTSA
jgi:phosphatidylcholine synthase